MYIASAASSVKFHDSSTGDVVHHYSPSITKPDNHIKSISWSKDGNWLFFVPTEGHAEIVSVKANLKLIHTITDIEEPSCAAFQNTTKKNVVIGTTNGQVLVYDIKSRTVKKRFPRSASMITHVAFTSKDSHVAAACRNGEALVFSNTSNNLSCTLKVPRSSSLTVLKASVAKRNLIIGGSSEGVVVVWDINESKHKFSVNCHKAPVTSVAMSPINSNLVISTGLDRQYNLYDVVTNKCLTSVVVENSLTSVDFSPDGQMFATGSQSGKIFVYDTRHMQNPLHSFDSHPHTSVKHVLFQHDQDSSSSMCSLTAENIKPMEEELPEEGVNTTFGMFLQSDDQPDEANTNEKFKECEDSFLAALGLNDFGSPNSMKRESMPAISDGLRKWIDSRSGRLDSPFQNINRLSNNRFSLNNSKKASSTPNPYLLSSPLPFSPINQPDFKSPQTGPQNLDEIKSIAQGVMQEEVKEIKESLKYMKCEIGSQIRRMQLDQHMFMVKQFLQFENKFNSAIKGLTSGGTSINEHYLQEEITVLKERNAYLEKELSKLSLEKESKESLP